MGWLFGKKKDVPKVPPESKLDDKALKFPTSPPPEKVIEPEKVKEAAGFDKPLAFPEEPMEKEEKKAKKRLEKMPMTGLPEPMVEDTALKAEDEELYVKVDVYQRIIGEMNSLKKGLNELSDRSKKLETSEFNEERNFGKLKRQLKSLHDNLLQMDKTIFKS